MALDVIVAADLADVIRVGVLALDVARQLERDAALDEPLRLAAAGLRERARDIGPARTLYKAIGVDPTKTRPSSEALLRRVRRGEELPRVNTAVDLCNWCSVEVQLPYGLYDRDRVSPPVDVRRGRAGEAYAGIRKDEVHLEGRLLVADRSGPFGNPTSDSARTAVGAATRRLLLVVFAPRAAGRPEMDATLSLTSDRYVRWAEAREVERWIS